MYEDNKLSLAAGVDHYVSRSIYLKKDKYSNKPDCAKQFYIFKM